MTSAFVNAKLREESLETIPTHSRQTTALTLSKRTNTIWSQDAIRNTGIDCTFARQQGQTLHSTSMRQIHIPWQSSGQHSTLPDQRHCIPIIKPTTDTMQQTLQLLDYLATQEDAVLSYHASNMVLAGTQQRELLE
jgi:hypothetical protein